jgi:hypothetical protein
MQPHHPTLEGTPLAPWARAVVGVVVVAIVFAALVAIFRRSRREHRRLRRVLSCASLVHEQAIRAAPASLLFLTGSAH